MNFFFTTPAGAVDFYVVVAMALFGLWRGSDTALACLVLLAVFIADRAILRLMPVPEATLIWAAAQTVGALVILWFAQSGAVKAAAALYILKIAALGALATGSTLFSTTANLLTVVFYLQVLFILAGAIGDGNNGSASLDEVSSVFIPGGNRLDRSFALVRRAVQVGRHTGRREAGNGGDSQTLENRWP